MTILPLTLALSSILSLVSATPLPVDISARSSVHEHNPLIKRADKYVVYGGDGTVAKGWPAQSAWVSSFDSLFSANVNNLKGSCSQWGVPNNSDSEISSIKSAISTVAGETGVDARYILAVVMQESNGCVRAPTTNGGVRNPGLMQSHNGAGTCNENGVKNPCPSSSILQMIRDGTAGTSSGEGLKGALDRNGKSDVSKYYRAARLYNSGSIDSSGNLGRGIATHCYSSDIANRLTGWVSVARLCNEGTIGNNNGSGGGNDGGNNNGGTTSPTGPAWPGASGNCKLWYTVQSGDYCSAVAQKFGISLNTLIGWNSGLTSDCSNLWLGYSYCVKA